MSQCFARHPRALWRVTLDAVVVLPPGAEAAVVVAGVGPAVWASTRDPRTLDELTHALELTEREAAAAASVVAQLLDCGALRGLPTDGDDS